MNKKFLNYFGKNYGSKNFTINDLMNDKMVREYFTIKECEENMEYKSFEIRVAKEQNQDIKDLEKDLNKMKNEYKELTDKDWDTTTYYLDKTQKVNYSEMDEEDLYYQQRFEQELNICTTMIGVTGHSIPFNQKYINKMKREYMKMQNIFNHNLKK